MPLSARLAPAALAVPLILALAACAAPAPAAPGDAVDWDNLTQEELVALAEEEGTVAVYAFTSRIAAIEEAFEATYPGIDVVASDISSTELIQRLATENAAGSATADVAYVSDAPVVVRQLLADGVLVPYLPPRVADALPAEYQTPLAQNRLSTKVLMYNEEANPDGSPVANLWELTEPAWSGRVVMVDPSVRGDYLDLVTEMSLRADEMAAAYEDYFGAPIELADGVPDAGLQFVADLLRERRRARRRHRHRERGRRSARPGEPAGRLQHLLRPTRQRRRGLGAAGRPGRHPVGRDRLPGDARGDRERPESRGRASAHRLHDGRRHRDRRRGLRALLCRRRLPDAFRRRRADRRRVARRVGRVDHRARALGRATR